MHPGKAASFSPGVPAQQGCCSCTANVQDMLLLFIVQLRLTLCDPMDCSPQASLSFTISEFAQTYVHQVGDDIHHLILCLPLLLLPSIFLSIRVFSNESVLPIRWPKYQSFSFSTSPSNDSSGLIFFRINWFDLLAVKYTWLFVSCSDTHLSTFTEYVEILHRP